MKVSLYPQMDFCLNSDNVLVFWKYSNDVNEYKKQLKDLLFLTFQNNGLVTPEESSYWYNTRDEALDALVQMTLDRAKGEFVSSHWNISQQIDGLLKDNI